MPILWARLGAKVIVVDLTREALKWQIRKSKEARNESVSAVLADGRNLPFKDETISAVSCISVIEHIPNDGDIQTVCEIGRVLKPHGVCVISFPTSKLLKSYFKKEWTAEIPPILKILFKRFLPIIFLKFNVDRTFSYFERFYSLEDVNKRIVIPSKCVIQELLTLKSGLIVKFIYENLIPTGVFTFLEFLIARFLILGINTRDMDALILKMRKP